MATVGFDDSGWDEERSRHPGTDQERKIEGGGAGSETYVPLWRLLAFDLLETKPALDETITFARGL